MRDAKSSTVLQNLCRKIIQQIAHFQVRLVDKFLAFSILNSSSIAIFSLQASNGSCIDLSSGGIDTESCLTLGNPMD